MATTIGYARVSTSSQHLDMQLDALKASGCTRIHTDTASGALAARPGLDQALAELDEGDTLVVWTPQRAEAAAALLAAGATVTQVAQALGVSRATNSPDGDWGDVEDTAIDLNPDQRKKVAAWVATQVADDYADRVEQAAADVKAARKQLDDLLLQAVKAGASKTKIAAAADITRQTLDARTGHWRRRESEVVEQ